MGAAIGWISNTCFVIGQINNSDVAGSASYNYNTRLQSPAYASSHYAGGFYRKRKKLFNVYLFSTSIVICFFVFHFFLCLRVMKKFCCFAH